MSETSKEVQTASITERLAALGSERWAAHFEGRERIATGEDLIELTIGEPDVATPPHLIEAAARSMKAGRTRYSSGKGEAVLLEAVAQKYAARTGRAISPGQVLAFPGTQAALAICMMALVEKGDAVLVPDPCYATYEGVVRATGADFVPVATSAGNGFHLTAEQLETAIRPGVRGLLLNSPHNPTGAVLSDREIAAIGDVCRKHDLWILSDEVYENLIFDAAFASPFDRDDLADRTIVTSSISKSHAAPGFRAGWAVGPQSFIDRTLGISEAILFGGQPFIADMTALALTQPDDTARTMTETYMRRSRLLRAAFQDTPALNPLMPEAGMFMLLDVSASGMDGETFANRLLDFGVSAMPGSSFGAQAKNFIRLSLTVADSRLEEAAGRIVECARGGA